ncbi:hypothetical protein CYMTET_29027 [Cymbomonas tetramitiformis]|uniref:NADP-dependent oxidoreductase domain-containing protein n=1 Tax=Cymbomonas tetramitiformis TaxID=36881 RepID=A0AAE0KVB4_9CHLO|nr:hypothetical protein CYMTET_29027 [Cymbomonas tetramitiformis]|eukprot:gene19810-23694_t
MAYKIESIPADAVCKFCGENIPRIGLGMAALGRPGYINLGHNDDVTSKSVEDMRRQAASVLDAAEKIGVKYFDAARSYGKAEEFLSSWIEGKQFAPEDLVVGSKWGYYYTADWQVDTGGEPHEVKEHSLSNLQKQTLLSDELLGRSLNLYQIHSATLDSGVLENVEVLNELAKMKDEKGWRIGLTLSGVAQAETLQKAMLVSTPSGAPLFDCVQATWNLLEQSAGDALLAAHNAGMDVIVKEAMANGRLTDRNLDPEFAPKLEALQLVAKQMNTTVDALALACVLAQPFNAMVLSGAACVEHLESNYAATTAIQRLQVDTVIQLMETCKTEPQAYWTQRTNLAWN